MENGKNSELKKYMCQLKNKASCQQRVSAITAEFPLGNSTRFAKLGASAESTRALSRY